MLKKLLQITSLCILLTACGQEEEKAPQVPEPDIKLVPAEFSALSGWREDNLAAAKKAFGYSCEKIAKIKTPWLGTAEIKVPTAAYQNLCRQLPELSPAEFKKLVEKDFRPWLVENKGNPKGKFTSYYEAALRASYRPGPVYKYPIYGIPEDLVEINLQDFDPALPRKKLFGRVEGQKFIPYYTRDEITSRGIDAPVILWTDSYIDLYIMQIQGSAVAELEDGGKIRIAYAGNNGHEFTGIGKILLENKVIKPGQASMGNIKKWLRENVDTADFFLNQNRRYIFHRLSSAEGPLGAQGVPLTAGRSLAVDRRYVPLGSLLWLETTLPGHQPLQRLMVAQDIGSAIKGAVRGDYFWGSGGDEILESAGKMNAEGKYYILLPRNQEEKHD